MDDFMNNAAVIVLGLIALAVLAPFLYGWLRPSDKSRRRRR
jgi:hypothetical protein